MKITILIIAIIFLFSSYAETQQVQSIYFSKIDRNGTINRIWVARNIPSSDSPLADVLRLLLNGPTNEEKREGILSLIPEETRVLFAIVRRNTAYISFNEDFLMNSFGVEGYNGQLDEITLTIGQFSAIDNIQILIEGRKTGYLGGSIWIGSALPLRERTNEIQGSRTRQAELEAEFDNFLTQHKNQSRELGSPLLVLNYRTNLPNTAGGVNCSLEFINITDKRIKYVYFTVVPYNRVDDIAYSEIGRVSSTTIEVVNYILPNETYIANWENVWYNASITYMRIIEIRVIFDDNTSITINEDIEKAILTPEKYVQFYSNGIQSQ
jgi:hypothetical protein